MIPRDNLKEYLDSLVEKYRTPDFIENDPVKFVHRFSSPEDMEVAGFIASTLAMGSRALILINNEKLFKIMNNKPFEFIVNFDPYFHGRMLSGFTHTTYRKIEGEELSIVFFLLRQVIEKYGSLKNLFLKYYSEKDTNIKRALSGFVRELFSMKLPPKYKNIPDSISSLVPDPSRGSPCKRLNMFLRWMVRSDCVDVGLWKEIKSSKLVIPLDVHVSRMSRVLGLTHRKTNSWRTAEEITENLKRFDPEDPVKYDFAIFGLGMELKKSGGKLEIG